MLRSGYSHSFCGYLSRSVSFSLDWSHGCVSAIVMACFWLSCILTAWFLVIPTILASFHPVGRWYLLPVLTPTFLHLFMVQYLVQVGNASPDSWQFQETLGNHDDFWMIFAVSCLYFGPSLYSSLGLILISSWLVFVLAYSGLFVFVWFLL